MSHDTCCLNVAPVEFRLKVDTNCSKKVLYILEYKKKITELDEEIEKLDNLRLKTIQRLNALKREKEDLKLEHSLNQLKNRPDTSVWLNEEYPWTKKVNEVLKNTFGFDKFRSNQLAAINATLSKKHVLIVMPTGGGKSLIYQLSALITGNVSVVISPLIALIEDQLMALKKMGISAATINSNSSKDEKKVVTQKLLANKLNLIFVTPEWMARTKIFMNNLTKIHKEGKLARFVIDEVHCCSQWGHDFRTDYLSLSLLKGQFPGVPILGLTATATSSVMVDLQKILEIPDAVVITSPYNRSNLFYRVVNKPETTFATLDYIEKLLKSKYKDQSGIIYAGTQKECEELATDFKKRQIRAAPYHANMDAEVKSKVHKRWIENEYQVIIATIAFGMGIDKPDVRYVIHYTVPKTLEGLYQESGRAGRDGNKADCTLLFNLNDWLRNFSMTKNKKEEKSVKDILFYCIDVATCRRKMISKYFDDDWRSSDCQKMCDHCKNNSKPVQTYNIHGCLKEILQLVKKASDKEINLTLKKLLEAWLQTGPKNLQLSSSKPKFTKEQAEHIIAFLLTKNYLVVRRGYSLVTTLAYIDVNYDMPVDSKNCGKQLPMDYCGTIKDLPELVKEPKTDDNLELVILSGNDSSGDDVLVDSVGTKSSCSRYTKRISSTSSENSNVSSSSFSEPQKKKFKQTVS